MRAGLPTALVLVACLVAGDARSDEPAAASPSHAAAGDEVDEATLFRSAVASLAADHASEAIAALEALGDRGVKDPVVSFNRGLAYAGRVRAGSGSAQPGDLGRAVHGFEEARELTGDRALKADAESALASVRAEIARRRSRAGDPIELESGMSLGRSITRLLPENVWAVLAAIFSAALTLGILIRARAKASRVAVAGTTTCVVAGALLMVSAVVLSSARDTRRHLREAIVIANSARLLDDKHIALVSVPPLPEGARVQLVSEGVDFVHVVAGRAVGWLPSSTLLPLARK